MFAGFQWLGIKTGDEARHAERYVFPTLNPFNPKASDPVKDPNAPAKATGVEEITPEQFTRVVIERHLNDGKTADRLEFNREIVGKAGKWVLVSPVKVRTDAFNQPVLGDRVWGTYNVLPAVIKKTSVEVYILHHDQNRPGGFTSGSWKDGTDRLRTNSFGFRASGPAVRGFKYSIEGVLQNGEIGPAEHKASAWFSSVSRRWKPGSRTLDISGEYKYASGTDNPADTKKSGTYDQLYPANHDKFGHEDLLGWRNLHNARSLAAYGLTKNLTLSVMYDSFWLASPKDGLYSGSGKLIARSSNGTAGRHVGQELDVFGTYKYGRFSFGAGCGRFFAGEFIRATTPGVGPTYMYLFHNYTL